MAVEAFGKTASQMKRERTVAKSAFTKAANFITRGVQNLTKGELLEEFDRLTCEARKLCDANDDYRAGLLADLEAKEKLRNLMSNWRMTWRRLSMTATQDWMKSGDWSNQNCGQAVGGMNCKLRS